MEEALRAYILAIAGMSSHVANRVDWMLSPQGRPYPSVILYLIDEQRPMNLAGPGSWQNCRVQIDVWDTTHKKARDIANLIAAPAAKGGMHGLRDTLSGIRFRIFIIDRDASTDEDKAETGGIRHRSRLDLNVWWSKLSGA